MNYPKGGVQLVYSPEEVEECAKGMVGDCISTNQMIFVVHIRISVSIIYISCLDNK